MQNTQNAEIQQRVINLVELYHVKVGKESEIAKQAKKSYDQCENEVTDELAESNDAYVAWPIMESPKEWVEHLMVNEQLLGHFYAVAAGDDAEQEVLDQLLPNVYDKDIFTEEEESFLAAHFKDMVNYIISSPSNDSLKWVNLCDNKNAYTIPKDVLCLIKSQVEIAAGSKIYYPATLLAQLASLFDDCFYCCTTMSHAWTRIATYANNITTEAIEEDDVPSSCDAIVSYLPCALKAKWKTIITHMCEAYGNMQVGGKLVFLCPKEILVEEGFSSFRKMLTDDNAVKEIIQLPNGVFGSLCLLIAEKGNSDHKATFIDARTAGKECELGQTYQEFDFTKFCELLQNKGEDPCTGLKNMATRPTETLSYHFLIPQLYLLERPSESDCPVPLSNLCVLESSLIRDVKSDLPEDTPWICMGDITPLFTGDLDMANVTRANCPNNPVSVEGCDDYAFDEHGIFADSIFKQMNTRKGAHVLQYRLSTFVKGDHDAILLTANDGRVAIVRATGKPYAVSQSILVFYPKENVASDFLAAILRMPIVYRQLKAYQEFGYQLDNIFVPTNKRVVNDERDRMRKEKSVTNKLDHKVQAMKTDYINEVRMRKHDMGQKVFDLINTEDLIRYYVESRETESDIWTQIGQQLDHFRSTIRVLSEMLDHLSQEDHFGKPEPINLHAYFTSLKHSNNINGFTLSYQLDLDSFPVIQNSRMTGQETRKADIITNTTILIAKNDLQRVVSNILNNAQKHGFVDSNRKDHEINILLKFNHEKEMFQIDFRNNGQPLPEGMSKMRYGIKGEKAGKNEGTGIGGYVVKSIVEHYKGDYDIFMDEGWTVVRIYLPQNI